MQPWAPDLLTKKLICVSVSVTKNCPSTVLSRACSAGTIDVMFDDLQAVVGTADKNSRLPTRCRVHIDAVLQG